MKIKVVVVDLELSDRTKRWLLRVGVSMLVLCAGAVALAAGTLHSWSTGDTLQATDLNGNFTAVAGQITDLQSKTHTASAFRATLTSATAAQTAVFTPVLFDQVDFDLAGEYNATSGVFSPKEAGVYLIVCAVEYSPTVAGSLYGAAVFLNGARFGLTEINASTANGSTPEHTMVAKLAANDAVKCETDQYTGAAAAVYSMGGLTHFEAARLY